MARRASSIVYADRPHAYWRPLKLIKRGKKNRNGVPTELCSTGRIAAVVSTSDGGHTYHRQDRQIYDEQVGRFQRENGNMGKPVLKSRLRGAAKKAKASSYRDCRECPRVQLATAGNERALREIVYFRFIFRFRAIRIIPRHPSKTKFYVSCIFNQLK